MADDLDLSQLTAPVQRDPWQARVVPYRDPTVRDMASGFNDVTNALVGPQSIPGQAAGATSDILTRVFGASQGGPVETAAHNVASGLPRTAAALGIGALTGTGPLPLIADSAEQTYAETGSPVRAGISAAAQALPIAGAKYGGNMAEAWAAKLAGNTVSEGLAPAAAGRITGSIAGGGIGMEAQRQTELTAAGVPLDHPSRNPLSLDNMMGQTVGALMFGGADVMHHVSDPYNWWSKGGAEGEPFKPTPMRTALPEGSIDVKTTPGDVDWRGTVVKNGLDDISTTQDTGQRAAKVSHLTDIIQHSASMENMEDNVEREAQAIYVKPPANAQELLETTARINTLQQDALRLMDERSAAGEQGTTSAAAYKQLQEQGWIKEQVTPDTLKQWFGEGVDRSLTNDTATGYKILTQKLANRMFEIADLAKQLRSEQPVNTPQSKKSAVDQGTTAAFIDAVGKVPDKELRDQLYQRFNFHENLDNRTDSGTARTFMQDVTHLVNHISSGKDPAEVGWKYDQAPFMKKTAQTDEQGNEVRPAQSVGRSLSDYVKTGADGKYTLAVYGRSNRSQRELVASQRPGEEAPHDIGEELLPGEQPPKVGGSLESRAGPLATLTSAEPAKELGEEIPTETEQEPEGKDMGNVAQRLRDHVAQTSPDDLWNTIAPELMNTRGSVHPILEGRLRPVVKDFVNSVLETGLTQQGSNVKKGELSESGKRLATALGVNPNAPRSQASELADRLRKILGSGGRDANETKQGIIRAVSKEAKVGGGKTVGMEGFDDWVKNMTQTSSMMIHPGVGDFMVDMHREMTRFFRNLGMEPELVSKNVQTCLAIASNFSSGEMRFGRYRASPGYQYGFTDRGISSGQQVPGIKDTAWSGGYSYGEYGKTPMIGMALDHVAQKGEPNSLLTSRAIATLAHEFVHDLQYRGVGSEGGIPGTAYQRERVGAWNQLNEISETWSSQDKGDALSTLAHIVYPHDVMYSGPNGTIHPVIAGGIGYGAGEEGHTSENRKYEFVNKFVEMVAAGMITGGNGYKLDPDTVFMHLPEEQALFAKGMYRDLSDNLTAIHQAVSRYMFDDPVKARDMADALIPMIRAAKTVAMSQEPQASIHQANQLMAALNPGLAANWSGPSVPFYRPDPQEQALEIEQKGINSAHTAMDMVQGLMFGPDPGARATPTAPANTAGVPPKKGGPTNQLSFPFNDEKKPWGSQPVNIGWVWRNAPLFMQTLQHLASRGIPLASDVMSVVKDIEPAQTRLAMMALSPYMTLNGKFDPSNPTLGIEPGTPLRDAVNKVGDWQQRNKQQAFAPGKDQKLSLTDKAKESLGLIVGRLNNNDLQTLVGAVQNIQTTHKILGEQLLQSRVSSASDRVARLIMAVEPATHYDQAKAAGQNIVSGLTEGQGLQVLRGLQPLQQPTREATLGLANSGLVESLQALKGQLAKSDWFMTEQRPGDYLVESYKNGTRHVDGATDFAQAQTKRMEMTKQGFTDIKVINKKDKNARDFSAPESILQHYIEVEREAQEKYLTTNPSNLSPEQVAQIRAFAPTPGAAIESMLERKGTNRYLIHRRDVPSALGMDYLDNMRDYISRLSSTIARQGVQHKVDLIHADARLNGQDQFKQYVNDNIRAGSVPTGTVERSIRAFSSAYFLAANLSSTMVIGSHGLQTLPETLTKLDTSGGWLGNAMKHLGSGISDITYLTTPTTRMERDLLTKSAQAKLNAGVPMSPKEMKVLAWKKAVDEKLLDAGLFQDLTHDDDVRAMMARQFGVGDKVPVGDTTLLTNGLYRISKFAMGMHSAVSGFNNKVGFLAGLNQAIAQGKSFDEAYKHADNVRTQALFGGGKINQPGYMAEYGNPKSIPVMRTMYTLQRYSTGFMGRYLEHVSDMFSKDPNLSSAQRVQAAKSFGTLTMTQLALSGLLGLPGVAAIMALLEKKGVPAQAAVREGLAHLAGADKDPSGFRGLLTETAMNGLPNQLFGVNIGPRLGVQDYMGTSAYDGYNLADLAGPLGSLVSNMYNGLGYIAQGQTQKGITTFAPNFVKRPIDMAMTKLKYGDYGFRDQSGEKLFDPSTRELLGYTAGLNPSRLSEKQTMKRLIDQSSEQYRKGQEQDLRERGAQLAQGNPAPAYQYAKDQVQTGVTKDPLSAIRKVADVAARSSQPQDPLANVPLGNAAQAESISKTFPAEDLSRRLETPSLIQRMRMEALAGVPKTDYSKDISKAVIMDSLIKRQGMTRAQAERAAVLMGF